MPLAASVPIAPSQPGPAWVVGSRFEDALTRLVGDGWRVAVPAFPRLAPWQLGVGLEGYRITSSRVTGHRRLRLTVDRAVTAPGSPALPVEHPPTAMVPSLVGRSYEEALAMLDATRGVYLRLGRVGALRAASSRRGLAAFVVTAQTPSAGSVIPAYGAPVPNGVDLGPSVVTISLGVRGPIG